jgi:hypothetical protein
LAFSARLCVANGATISVGAADVFAVSGGSEVLCGAVLATTRNFELKV